jgi:predicted small secreted protein
MKKRMLMIMAIMLGSAFLQGCETIKGTTDGARCGVKKDVVNTGHHAVQAVNAVLEADRRFAEKYW